MLCGQILGLLLLIIIVWPLPNSASEQYFHTPAPLIPTSIFLTSLFRHIQKWQKATISFVWSVCPFIHPFIRLSAWNNSAPTIRICIKDCIWGFFENMSTKFKSDWTVRKVASTLHEDVCTFVIIFRWILLTMKNISDKICRKNKKKYILKIYSKILAICEIIFTSMVEPERPQTTM
jgi:hypothetical protein